MNNKLKRFVSALSAAALLSSSITALAAQITTDTNYWKQTFDGMTRHMAPETMSVSEQITAEGTATMVELDETAWTTLEEAGVSIGGKNAVFGKPETDGAFAIEQASAEYNGKITLKTLTDTGNDMKAGAGIKCPIGAANFAHLGFQMAVSDYSYTRTAQITIRDTTKRNPSSPTSTMFTVDTAGEVKIFGAATGYTMPQNKWVRYDFVFGEPENKTDGSYVDVYADGELIIAEKRFDASGSKGMQQLGGIEYITFTFPTTGESGSYVDNLIARKLTAKPEFDAVNLSHSDPELDGRIDNQARVINLVAGTAAADFLAGLNRQDVQIVDTVGIAQESGVADGYIIVGGGDEAVYYTLLTYQQNYALKENFEGVSITDNASLATETGMTLNGAALLSVQAGLGARDMENHALAMEIAGDNTLNWTAGTAIGGSTATVEASVMLAGSVSAELVATAGTEPYTLAAWNADHSTAAAGKAAAGWKDYAWYKTVTVLNQETGIMTVYVNGKEMAAVPMSPELLAAEGINGFSLKLAGTGTIAVDDMFVHTGEYVPGTDDIVLTAKNTNYIVDEKENILYIPADTTADEVAANVTISDNAELDAIYTDTTMSVQTAGQAANGNYLVLVSKIRSVYEAYRLQVTDRALGIDSVTSVRMKFDNAEETVFAPAYMTASAFVESIVLLPGHTGEVINEYGSPADKIGRGTIDGYQYVVTYSNGVNTFTKTYDILTQYIYETFDDLAGVTLSAGQDYNGINFGKQGVSGGTVYAQGGADPKDPEEPVAELYSKAGSTSGEAKLTFRLDSKDVDETKKPYALTWDVFTNTTSGFEKLIVKYTHKDGTPGKFQTMFELTGGTVKFNGAGIGTYTANTWNRIIMLINPSGTGRSRIYLNGKKIFDNNVGMFQKTIDSIQEFIYCHSVSTAEHHSYYDNMAFYPISSVEAFDATPIDCIPKTTYDILKGDTVSGYGPATAAQVLDLFTYPAGAAYGVYEADGKTPVAADVQAAEGMKMIVTSANGQFSETYTLAEPIRITAPKLLIEGREMKYLVPGAATATAGIYSAYPLPLELKLTYTDGTDTNTVICARPADSVGQFDFVTEVVGDVKNAEGEKLTLTFTDPRDSTAYAEPTEIIWTGRLDLSSEITGAKNGATSIVTLTFDDGLVNTLNKCSNWFEQYGLRGSSVIWSDRALGADMAKYQKFFDSGYFDLTSHSKTHANLSTMSGLTDERRLQELKESRDILRKTFGQEVLTFAPSNNKLDAISQSMVDEYYWAVRQGSRGYNSISPEEGDKPGQWNNLYMQGNYNPIDRQGKDVALNDILDEAIKEPTWMIEMHHSIESKEGVGTLPILDSTAASHFKKLGEMQDAGLIWVATMDEATKYIRERQHTQIDDVATETKRTIYLKMDTDYLPAETFNYPLTVKSTIPAEWAAEGKYIKVDQDGKIQAPEVRSVDGSLCVLYDAYPTGGPITLELTDERPAVTVTAINISAAGTLTQTAGEMEPVVFTASTTPVENTDTSGIQWYVNDQLRTDIVGGSLTFDFLAEKKGTYKIYAKDALSGFTSKTITVTLVAPQEPGVLFEDDFDGYGALSTMPSTNWYTNLPIGLEEYPADCGDVSAAIGNGTTGWPGMHKTVSTPEGQPVVYSGSLAMVGGVQEYFLEMRRSKNDSSTNRITGIKFQGSGNIIGIDGKTIIAKNPTGKWLHYTLTIVPQKTGTLSKVRVVLNGDDLTDANGQNKGQPVIYETEYDLSKLEMVENGSLNMVHNHNFSKTGADKCTTYLNDIRIYNPQTLALKPVADEFLQDEAVTLKFNSEVYGFDSSMLSVIDASGNAFPVESVQFDTLGRRALTLTFAEELQQGVEYTVTVNGGSVLTNVLGEQAGTGTGKFLASSLNSIREIQVTAEGPMMQMKDSIAPVAFTAATTPAENVDLGRIDWYVNGKAQDVTGKNFTFTPETVGSYEITARAGKVVSNVQTIVVKPAAAKAIVLEVLGALTQSSESLSDIIFTAKPDPADCSLDTENVVWYVDDIRTNYTGERFIYRPEGVGSHEIHAVLGTDEAVKSPVKTVTVVEVAYNLQKYLFEDDFEDHGPAGTKFTGKKEDGTNVFAPWAWALCDSDKWIESAADPENSGNMVGKFGYANVQDSYPRLELGGLEVAYGKPFVVSSKVYLNQSTANLILEGFGKNKKEMVKLANNKVQINGVDVEGAAYPVGAWMWFAAYIVPGADLSQSTIRLVLSSGAEGKTVIESPLDLSAVEAGTGKKIRFNVKLSKGKNDAIYLDDTKAYYPETSFLIGEALPKVGEDSLQISFNHAIAPSTFNVNCVQLTVNGQSVKPAEVIFDPLSPDQMTVRLAEPVAAGTEYRLWLDSSVQDVAGSAVYGTLVFGDAKEPGRFSITAAEAAEGKTTVKVMRTNVDLEQPVKIYTAAYAGNILTDVSAATAVVEAGSGEQVIELPYSFTEPENGTIKVFVWEADGSMIPLW